MDARTWRSAYLVIVVVIVLHAVGVEQQQQQQQQQCPGPRAEVLDLGTYSRDLFSGLGLGGPETGGGEMDRFGGPGPAGLAARSNRLVWLGGRRTKMIQKWPKSGPKVIQKWSKSGPQMVNK